MQRLDMDQRSDEWFAHRLGIPTASRFSDIITSKGARATSITKTIHALVAEKMMGYAPDTYRSQWMVRGEELESEACAVYEMLTDTDVEHPGLCLLDSGFAGCSPDGLAGPKGLEIKCPAPHTHVKYLIDAKLPTEYIQQVQGSMWICELEQWDFFSYHPDLPPLLITVDRDEEYIDKLAALVLDVSVRVREHTTTLQERYKWQA